MRKGKMKAMALLMGAMLLLQPAVSAKAETQQPQEATVAQTIVYEGEVYELYKVEKLPSVSVFSAENEGIWTERDVINYYYRNARMGNIVSGEITQNTYAADRTRLATLKQTTQWKCTYTYRKPELLSANTVITYLHPSAKIQINEAITYVDTSLTVMYVVPYIVHYLGEVHDDEQIYTECDVYGNVW